jgi:hypothetical protein
MLPVVALGPQLAVSLLIVAFTTISAQTPATSPPQEPTPPAAPGTRTYEFRGKPIRIPGNCKAEDLNALGLTCNANEPCPLFLELSSAELVGNRILVTGNLHTSSATVESLLLASEDGGATWTEPAPRVSGGTLEDIQFLDFELGWIAGHIIMVRPREPFFLLTSDGGKTWRRRSVTTESGLGVVSQFRFDSRNHGLALIDKIRKGESGMRYEVYESMTGGESWMLQQVTDQPVPIRGPARADGALRIRAESNTKTYRLERKTGSTYSLAASFAINSGECKVEAKEPEPSEPEPPAEPESEPARPANPKAPSKPPTLKKP